MANKKDEVLEIVTVGMLCKQVAEAHRRAAIESYSEGSLHEQFLIAQEWMSSVKQGIEGLKKGKIEPHLNICCCKDTFAAILSEIPKVDYIGCEPEAGEGLNPDDYDAVKEGRVVVAARYVKGLSIEELQEYLTSRQNCSLCNFSAVNTPDAERQKEYYQHVCTYMKTAASLAKGMKSAAAEMFLEVCRLLTRRSTPDCSVRRSDAGLGLSLEQAKAAYDMAQKAQAKLWVDSELAKLRPLRIRTTRGKSNRG